VTERRGPPEDFVKATQEQKLEIERLHAEGMSQKAIGEKYGWSATYVGKIIKQSRNRLWLEHRRAIESHERSLKRLGDAIDRNSRAIDRNTQTLKYVMGRVSVAIAGVTKTREVLKDIQTRIKKLITRETERLSEQPIRKAIWSKGDVNG